MCLGMKRTGVCMISSKHVSSKVWPTGRNRNVLAGCICSTGRTVKGGEGEGEVTWNEGKEGRKS